MGGFWSGIWRSRVRATGVGLVLCAVIASVLYAFNWHTFYDTKGNLAERDAERVAADVAGLWIAIGSETEFRSELREYLARRRARVVVSRTAEGAPEWSETNGVQLKANRTRLLRSFELAEGIRVEVEDTIRPPLGLALWRAWTFSIGDYRADPARWRSEALFNRSLPLYGYLLTVLVVGFGTIRALHRDQTEIGRLEAEAGRIRDELAAAHERYAGEVEAMRGEIRRTETQRREAVEERERLRTEIATVEREYGELHQASGEGSPIHDEKLRAIAERKARIERALELHDQSIKSFENELGEVRSELDAAETLLGEMESRRGELDAKLRDRNRQIRQLQALADQARRDTHDLELGAARHARDDAAAGRRDARRSRLEEQLAAWVSAPGEAAVDFSVHSRTGKVESSFARIDRSFVDRYFTHVTNPAYERGGRRLIRVVSEPEGDTGQLIVALDDDAGRTLGLRFALRPESPDVSYVGFVLALLLRASCRDYRSFAIRVR